MPPFWVGFPGSAKRQVNEGRPNAFLTRLFDFPYQGETKKHPWERIPRGRFHASILGGLFQAAQKVGLTKVDQTRSKAVCSTFPIRAKRKKHPRERISRDRFHASILGGFSRQCKKSSWRRSFKRVLNAYFWLSPSGRNDKNILGNESHEVRLMPPCWMVFPRRRKKSSPRRSSKRVLNAYFQLSPPGRNERTPLETNPTE